METLALNNFDYIAIIILLIAGFSAFINGFIKDFFSILLWFLAIYVSMTFSYFATPIFTEYFQNETIIIVLSYATLFLVTVIAGTIALNIISKLVSWTGLGLIDRVLGFVFGAVKGCAILCAIFLAVPDQTKQLPFIAESRTIKYIEIGSKYLQVIIDETLLIYSNYKNQDSQSSETEDSQSSETPDSQLS